MCHKTLLRMAIVFTGLVSLLNASIRNPRAVSVLKTDACRKFCNKYEGLCIPASLDPMNVYEPHCTGAVGETQPSAACAHCIKARGLTSTSPKPTPTLETVTTPTTTTTEEAKTESVSKETSSIVNLPNTETSDEPFINTTAGSNYDKCQKVCGNFSEICLPEWLVMRIASQPHCEAVNNVGKPSASCLICLESKGSPDPKQNKCEMECHCRRLVIITVEAPTESCSTDGKCVGDDFSMPKRHASDVSTCECESTSTCSTEESTSWTSSGYYSVEPTTEYLNGVTSQNLNTVTEPVLDPGKLSTGEELIDRPNELTTQPNKYFSAESFNEPGSVTSNDFFTQPYTQSTAECICPTVETNCKAISEPTTEQTTEQTTAQYSILTSEQTTAQFTLPDEQTIPHFSILTGDLTSAPATEPLIESVSLESSTASSSELTTEKSVEFPTLPPRKPPVEKDFDYSDY